MFFQPILSIILFIPLAGTILLLFIPKRQEGDPVVGQYRLSPAFWFPCRWCSGFDSSRTAFKFFEKHDWIPSIGANTSLGIDGISLLLIMLTTVLGFLAMLSSWTAIEDRVKEYYVLPAALQTGMLGVFMSLDFFLFYVFWEVMLVPMYFLIGIWGGPRKLYAAIKFFLYTLVGSVLMLLGILALYF